jgi:hypothetical protein
VPIKTTVRRLHNGTLEMPRYFREGTPLLLDPPSPFQHQGCTAGIHVFEGGKMGERQIGHEEKKNKTENNNEDKF